MTDLCAQTRFSQASNDGFKAFSQAFASRQEAFALLITIESKTQTKILERRADTGRSECTTLHPKASFRMDSSTLEMIDIPPSPDALDPCIH